MKRHRFFTSQIDKCAEDVNSPKLVSDALQFLPDFRNSELTVSGRRIAAAQAAAIVRASDPLLEKLLDIRVITVYRLSASTSPRAHTSISTSQTNHINLRVAQQFTTMLHHERARLQNNEEVMFCFLASDQLEPIVIVVVIHQKFGRIEKLEQEHVSLLETAINQFKIRFGLKDETYSYTCLKDRRLNSVHSRHFHLKIRIPTEMYLRVFPAAQILGNNLACRKSLLSPFMQRWEPLSYKFQLQDLVPWSIVRLLILSDAEDSEYKP